MIIDRLIDENIQIKNENVVLHNKIDKIYVQIEEEKQYKLRKNIEIFGADETGGEDVCQTVLRIVTQMDLQLNENDIKDVYRLPAVPETHLPGNIIVRFKSGQKRDSFLKDYKTAKKNEYAKSRKQSIDITNSSQGTSSNQQQILNNNTNSKKYIFINEHLTNYHKFLLKKSKDYKKENKFLYVWTQNGTVLVRKTQKSPAKRITSIKALNELIK